MSSVSMIPSESTSVAGEPERKRQRRLPPSPSSSGSSGASSTSLVVSLTLPSSASSSLNVAPSSVSDQVEINLTSTPTDPGNWRGVRSREGLEMLHGDHFTFKGRWPGDKRNFWVLPRKLLTSHSPYFARMPSETIELKLYSFQEKAFELFAQWLYLGELNFDDVNVPSETLVRAWKLGNKFQCPAFKDHVMVKLIKSHRERGIKPITLRLSLVDVSSSTKLSNWAIDQFHAKIAYGYTGYDDQKKDHPSDNRTWKRYAENVEAFGQNFLKACLNAGQGANRVKKPWENGQQYMEVSRYAEIGVSKEKGGLMKAEATLIKAEGR